MSRTHPSPCGPGRLFLEALGEQRNLSTMAVPGRRTYVACPIRPRRTAGPPVSSSAVRNRGTTLSRRLANVTLDNLDDLPSRCRRCVFWELDPVSQARALEAGESALEKEAWVSGVLLQWGSCGKLVYVDGVAAGYVLYA